MTLSDEIVVMNQGVIEQIGPPQEIYTHPRTRFVADFIGRANFASARVLEVKDGAATVELFGKPVRIQKTLIPLAPGQPVTLVMRPEALRVGQLDSPWLGVVRRTTYLGDAVDYEIEVADQLLTIQDTDPMRPEIFAEGSQVGVGVVDSCVHVLAE
jgi:iron(III) transport system ATP-binding protein